MLLFLETTTGSFISHFIIKKDNHYFFVHAIEMKNLKLLLLAFYFKIKYMK
jgi:hypothetical protein